MEEVPSDLRYAPPIGRVEEGEFFESLSRGSSGEVGKVRFRVRIGEEERNYVAFLSEEPLSVLGARMDAHYDVWMHYAPKDPRGNLPVNQVGLRSSTVGSDGERGPAPRGDGEVSPAPLRVDIDAGEVIALKVEMRACWRAFDTINADPTVLRVACMMEEGASKFPRDRGSSIGTLRGL